MRALLQRVRFAKLAVEDVPYSEIKAGLCILLGVTQSDTEAEATLLADKIAHLRIFEDKDGKMNLSILDEGGAALVISQFTLYADTSHGRRPSFLGAARPQQAEPLYEAFKAALSSAGVSEIASGVFGANMQILLQNDGPTTIWMDTEDWKKPKK